jgi:uncharacterized protein YcfJ
MKSTKLTAVLLLVAVSAGSLTLSGCANTPEDRKLRGQVIGGVTGAAVGSMFGGGSGQVIMTGAGAVLGTVVGGRMAE